MLYINLILNGTGGSCSVEGCYVCYEARTEWNMGENDKNSDNKVDACAKKVFH